MRPLFAIACSRNPTRSAGHGRSAPDVPPSEMTEPDLANRTAEGIARVKIDQMLEAAGWAVQDAKAVNLAASRGVAVREFRMRPPHGRADYLLFLDGRATGVVEAKKEGATLTEVEWQSAKYVDGLPDELEPAVEGGLAFVYESTGTETRFTNRLDPDPASRPVFWFHRPETLIGWLEEIRRYPTAPTFRHRLRSMPEPASRVCGRPRTSPCATSRSHLRPIALGRSCRWPPDQGRRCSRRSCPTGSSSSPTRGGCSSWLTGRISAVRP